MQNVLLNWKTSAAGFAAVLGAFADILHAVSQGQIPNLQVDIPALMSGVGLILAKDGGVTGTAAK